MRKLWFAILAAACPVAALAQTAALAPIIDHQALTTCERGQLLTVRARIVSPARLSIFAPAVFVRTPGIPGFSRIEMKPEVGVPDTFVALLPSAFTEGEFDYYVETFDRQGNGPSRVGTPAAPLHVTPRAVAMPPPPALVPPLVAAGVTSGPDSDPLAETRATAGMSVVRKVGLVTGGVGVVAGAIGGLAGISALVAYDDEKRASNEGDLEEYEAAKEDAKRLSLAADIFYGVAGGLVAIGLVLALVGGSSNSVAPAVSVTRGGGTIGVSGRF